MQQSQHLANEHHIIENVKDPIVSPTLWRNVASWGKLICGRSHNNQLLYNEQRFMPVMHRVGRRENMTQYIFLQLKSFMEKNSLKALKYSSCELWTFLKRSPRHSSLSSLNIFRRDASVRALKQRTRPHRGWLTMALCHRERCSMLCSSLEGSGVWGRTDTCICMAESLCSPPETITIFVNWLHSNIK